MLTHRVAYNPHIHIAKNLIAPIDTLLGAALQVPYSKTLIGDDQVKVEIAPPAGSRPASGCSDGDADVPAAPAREAVPSGAEY